MNFVQENQVDIFQSFSLDVAAELSRILAEAEERALQQALNESDKAALVLSSIAEFYATGVREISLEYTQQAIQTYSIGGTNQALITRHVESLERVSINLTQAIENGLHINYQLSDEVARSTLYKSIARTGSKIIPYAGMITEAVDGDAAGVAAEGAGVIAGAVLTGFAVFLSVPALPAFLIGAFGGIAVSISLGSDDSDFRAAVDDYIEDFSDFVTLTIDPSQHQNITIKNYELNNGELAFPNGLQILHFVHRLDPSFDLDSVFSITEQSSSALNQGPEDLLHAFEKLFIGAPAEQPVLDAEDYFRRIVSLREDISNDTTGRFDPAGNFQLVTDDIFEQALLDTQEGRAARYALQELNPFIYTSQQESFYDYIAPNGELDLENFSEQYLADRSKYLSSLLAINANDFEVRENLSIAGDLDITINADGPSFAEVGLKVDLNQNPFFSAAAAEQTVATGTKRTYTIFDNDEDNDQLEGKDQNDHIYGAGGNDTLDGGKGNDYLALLPRVLRSPVLVHPARQGGVGNNTYRFDYGDGRDVIVGNGAADDINKLFIAHTDGGTASQVTRLALLVGSSVYQEVDGAGVGGFFSKSAA